jgi:hypothetical protein
MVPTKRDSASPKGGELDLSDLFYQRIASVALLLGEARQTICGWRSKGPYPYSLSNIAI